jgi:hypothetical protein
LCDVEIFRNDDRYEIEQTFSKTVQSVCSHYNLAGDLHIDILNDIPLGDGVIVGIGWDEWRLAGRAYPSPFPGYVRIHVFSDVIGGSFWWVAHR